MKNLILLFLVIGAVVSETTLTTIGTAATAAVPLWTITYSAVTGLEYLSFVVTYFGGTADFEPVAKADDSFGVACLFTDSAFDVNATQVRAGFSLSVVGNADTTGPVLVPTKMSVDTNWQPLVMTSHPNIKYNSAIEIETGGSGVVCPLVGTPADGKPVLTDLTATWTFTVQSGCGPIPQSGSAFYAKCFAIASETKLIATTTTLTFIAAGITDVTIAAATTTCATTGASTFATGATILAGIAYLQF
jgi:hypothetical protein